MKDTIYGPNREENEKKRDKILKAAKFTKVYSNGIFQITVPIKKEDVPPDELRFLEDNI